MFFSFELYQIPHNVWNLIKFNIFMLVTQKSDEKSYSIMLHVKSCNVKHISESVFCYFTRAGNSN